MSDTHDIRNDPLLVDLEWTDSPKINRDDGFSPRSLNLEWTMQRIHARPMGCGGSMRDKVSGVANYIEEMGIGQLPLCLRLLFIVAWLGSSAVRE